MIGPPVVHDIVDLTDCFNCCIRGKRVQTIANTLVHEVKLILRTPRHDESAATKVSDNSQYQTNETRRRVRDTTTTSRNHHCQAVRDAIVVVSSFNNTYSTESAMFARTKTITGLIYLVRGPGLEAGTC